MLLYTWQFESQDERQLKQIFDGQNAIHMTVRDLHRRLDEVIGRQERTLSQIAYMSQGGFPQAPPQGQGIVCPIFMSYSCGTIHTYLYSLNVLVLGINSFSPIISVKLYILASSVYYYVIVEVQEIALVVNHDDYIPCCLYKLLYSVMPWYNRAAVVICYPVLFTASPAAATHGCCKTSWNRCSIE